MTRISVTLAAPLALLLGVSLPGCLGPAGPSDACRTHDDCGACGRCDNGLCVYDELGAARPSCVDETEDPCNGKDDDGNGIVDDPEACWSPVWSWESADGARCFSISPLAPPAACAKYRLSSQTPAFALPARYVRGAVDLHQCSLGGDHVLVPAAPLFTPSVDADQPLDIDAWKAQGYDCGVVLGRTLLARPEYAGKPTPYGYPCALSRFDVVAGSALNAHVTWLGGGRGPVGTACDVSSVVWGVSGDERCTDAAPATCSRCGFDAGGEDPADGVPAASSTRSPYTAHLVAQSPGPTDHVPANAPYQLRITLANPGSSPWPPGFTLRRDPGSGVAVGVATLPALGPGESVVLTLDGRTPRKADGYRDTWHIDDQDGAPVLIDGALEFTTLLRVVDVQLHGVVVASNVAPDAVLAPGARFLVAFALRNIGETTWSSDFKLRRVTGQLAIVDEVAVETPIFPNTEGLVVLPLRLPLVALGGAFHEGWNLYDPDGRPVAFEVARDGGGTDYGSREGAFLNIDLVTGAPCDGTNVDAVH